MTDMTDDRRPCVHCGAPTDCHTVRKEPVCWPPCAFQIAELRAALSDPETADGAAALLDIAKVRVTTS
jgi:hypothetical protein